MNQQGAEDEGAILEKLARVLAEFPLSSLASTLPSPWSEAFKAGRWSEVVSGSEQALSGDVGDTGARLSWILAQGEIGEIPLSALCAPIDELVLKVRGDAKLSEFAGHTVLRLGKKLLEKKQYRLGVTLLEKSFGLLALPYPSQLALWEGVSGALESELRRAAVRRESKQYQSALADRIKAFQLSKPVPAPHLRTVDSPGVAIKKPVDSKRGFDSKAILERAATPITPEELRAPEIESEESRAAQFNPEKTVVQPFPLEFRTDSSGPSAVVKTGIDFGAFLSSPLLRIGVAISCVIGLLIFCFWDLFWSETGEDLAGRTAMAISVSVPKEPLGADLAQVGESGGALSDLTKRLQSLDRVREEQPGSASENRTVTGETADGDSELHTSSADALSPPPSVPSEKLPEMNTEKLEQTVLESLGGAGPVVRGADLVKGPDGRVYGPAPTVGDNSGVVQLDGQKVQGYEVEQFSEPLRYKILARTKVFSAPSVVGQGMAELQPEAVVQVVSRMGRWLEIRSTGGRRGFIYAQDAVEERSSETNR